MLISNSSVTDRTNVSSGQTDATSTSTYIHPSDSLLFIYNSIAVVVILLNAVHLFILKSMLRLRHHRNYKMFLMIVAASDLGLGIVRGLLSNNFVQQLMFDHSALCVTTSVIVHSLLLTMTSVMLLISIDRFLALDKERCYRRLIFVKHYSKIVTATISAFVLLYLIVGTGFGGSGFTVKGMGACKMGSANAPYLGLLSVSLCLLELTIMTAIYVKIINLTKKVLQSARRKTEKRNLKDILLTIGGILLAKVIFWCPIMITVIARAMKVDCNLCEWLGLITMSLNSVANPLLYGLTNQSYRMFLTRCICVDPKSGTSQQHIYSSRVHPYNLRRLGWNSNTVAAISTNHHPY